jgi:hypothetical protein
MSEINIHGKPEVTELAYAGYKEHIDIFIMSTLVKQVLRTDSLPFEYVNFVGNPISILEPPGIVFQFVKEPTEAQYNVLSKMFAEFDLQRVQKTKVLVVYTVRTMTFPFFFRQMLPLVKPTCPGIDGYCTVEAFKWSYVLYAGIEGFLATNTYPYFRNHMMYDGDDDEDDDDCDAKEGFLYSVHGQKRDVDDDEEIEPVKPKKKAKVAKGKKKAVDVDSEMSVHLEEDHVEFVLFTEVLKAKPSPIPYTVNVGTPQDVPHLPGYCFPYFHGMISTDLSYTRRQALNLFLSLMNVNLEFDDARDGYKEFRASITPFLYTAEGLVVQHIMKGIELALETQTQLFLLIENKNYLGFNLLGGANFMFVNNDWWIPLTRKELQFTNLSCIMSQSTSKAVIADLIQELPRKEDPDRQILLEDIDTSLKLSRQLANLKLGEKGFEETEKRLTEALKGLHFGDSYKSVTSISHIVKAVEMLTGKAEIPEDLPVYIPSDRIVHFRDPRFAVFCSFGSRSISFYAASGKSYPLVKDEGDNIKDQITATEKIGEKDVRIMEKVVVGVKPPHQCLGDWEKMLADKSLRWDVKERAKEARCCVFSKDKDIELIYRSLCVLLDNDDGVAKGKKRKRANVGGDIAAFDALFSVLLPDDEDMAGPST